MEPVPKGWERTHLENRIYESINPKTATSEDGAVEEMRRQKIGDI